MNLEELALLLGLTHEELVAKAAELNIDLDSIADELDEELISQLKSRLHEVSETHDVPETTESDSQQTDSPDPEREQKDAVTPEENTVGDAKANEADGSETIASEEVPHASDEPATDGGDIPHEETEAVLPPEEDQSSLSEPPTSEETADSSEETESSEVAADVAAPEKPASEEKADSSEETESSESADDVAAPETPVLEEKADSSEETESLESADDVAATETPVSEEKDVLTEETEAEPTVSGETEEMRPEETLAEEVLDSTPDDAVSETTAPAAGESGEESETFEVPLEETKQQTPAGASADETPVEDTPSEDLHEEEEVATDVPQEEPILEAPIEENPAEAESTEPDMTPEEVAALAAAVSDEEKNALGSGTQEAAAATDSADEKTGQSEAEMPAEEINEPEATAAAEEPAVEAAEKEEKKQTKGKKEKKAKKEKDPAEKGNFLSGPLSFFSDFFMPIFTTPVHRNILILGAVFSAVIAVFLSSLITPEVKIQPVDEQEAKEKELPPVTIRGGFRGEKDLFQLIWEMHLQGYYDLAYEYAQRFIEEHRDSDLVGDVYYKVADILYDWDRGSTTKQYKEARAAYEKAVGYMPDDPKVPWGLFQIANTYFFLNVFDAAIDSYRELMELYPTYQYLDIAQSRLAQCYLKTHEYGRAELEYKRLIEVYPNSSLIRNAHFKLAEIHYRKKDLKKSIAAYKEYLKKYPHTPKRVEVLFRMAKLQKYMKNFDQAILYFEKSIDKYPHDTYNELATYEIAECNILLKKFEEARSQFTKLIELYPKHDLARLAYHRIGDAYLQEGKDEEAIEVYEKALASFPDLHVASMSKMKLADLYFRKGDYDQAISLFSDILVTDPNYYANDRIVFRIAQAHYKKENYLEATDWYLRLIREYPMSLLVKKAYFDKAQAEIASNFYERAINSYNEFVKKYPDHPHVDLIAYLTGDMYFRLGKYMDAIGYWEDMRAKYPLSDYRYKALNDIGKTYIKMSESPAYFETLREEFEVRGTDEEIKRGLELKAQETFLQIIQNKALEGNDEYFNAGKELAEFYYRSKEYEKALGYIDTLLGLYSSHEDIHTVMNLKASIFFELNLVEETIAAYEDLISLLTFRLSKSEEQGQSARDESYRIMIADSYFTLGDLFFSQDKISESLYLYLEGLKKLPEGQKRGWPLYQVANCYSELNNYDKANYYYDLLKKDFPDDFWTEYVGWNKERLRWKQQMQEKGIAVNP